MTITLFIISAFLFALVNISSVDLRYLKSIVIYKVYRGSLKNTHREFMWLETLF